VRVVIPASPVSSPLSPSLMDLGRGTRREGCDCVVVDLCDGGILQIGSLKKRKQTCGNASVVTWETVLEIFPEKFEVFRSFTRDE